MDQTAISRIAIERKKWRKDHPHGFFAKPAKNADGTNNLSLWHCGIPGKKDTLWENGMFKLDMHFPPNYPTRPPKCKFTPVIFHPNVYPSGTVCLSILNEEEDYQPSLSVSDILLGIQALLDAPNLDSPAQEESFKMLKMNIEAYNKRIKEQTKRFIPID